MSRKRRRFFHLFAIGLAACGCAVTLVVLNEKRPPLPDMGATLPPMTNVADLAAAIKVLEPLHEPISEPGPIDWLARHDEPGQTFEQYLVSSPITPGDERRTIYIQPIGSFTDTQREIITNTAAFMALFYNAPVEICEDIPMSAIPERARRINPNVPIEQVLTTYILHEVLYPELPDAAAAYIAFTSFDLWPGRGWNFVFGEATIHLRVGVWSIYRNGDPDESDANYKLCLLRTMKTAVHETGHMFSMLHCTAYECCMCGSNHRGESDRRPVWFCPECVMKVCWATKAHPVKRYDRLAEFCGNHGFDSEADFYERSASALRRAASPTP
jgi:archaemetzincin